jgi:hypothetical protein
MARQWYPYQALGEMYVHTNYDSFKSNIGSFGSHTDSLENIFYAAILEQYQREEKIDALMIETIGIGIDGLIDYIKNWHKEYEKNVNKAWFSDTIIGKHKYGLVLSPLFSGDLEKGIILMQDVAKSIVDLVSSLGDKGIIKLENFEVLAEQINNQIEILISNIDSQQSSGKESGVFNSIRGSIFAIKGLVWEYFIAAVLASFFEKIQNNSELTLISTGGMKGAKGDHALKILNNTNLMLSVKSTSMKTFADSGLYLHHGSIGSILEYILQFSPGAGNAVSDAKYYLINASRMLASPMTSQGGNKGGIDAIEGGYELINSLLKTYATVFMGHSNLPSEGKISEDIRQADILIIQDNAFRKSDLLMGIALGDYRSRLKIDYSHSSADYWRYFDYWKRAALYATKGDYSDPALLAFVRPEAEKLLNQRASVMLNLLTK